MCPSPCASPHAHLGNNQMPGRPRSPRLLAHTLSHSRLLAPSSQTSTLAVQIVAEIATRRRRCVYEAKFAGMVETHNALLFNCCIAYVQNKAERLKEATHRLDDNNASHSQCFCCACNQSTTNGFYVFGCFVFSCSVRMHALEPCRLAAKREFTRQGDALKQTIHNHLFGFQQWVWLGSTHPLRLPARKNS